MKTRSQTNYENSVLYEVNINFDHASNIWRENKRYVGNGSYKYVCIKKDKNNNFCKNKCLVGEEYCKTHFKMHIEGRL
jgi:hypothetical protein